MSILSSISTLHGQLSARKNALEADLKSKNIGTDLSQKQIEKDAEAYLKKGLIGRWFTRTFSDRHIETKTEMYLVSSLAAAATKLIDKNEAPSDRPGQALSFLTSLEKYEKSSTTFFSKAGASFVANDLKQAIAIIKKSPDNFQRQIQAELLEEVTAEIESEKEQPQVKEAAEEPRPTVTLQQLQAMNRATAQASKEKEILQAPIAVAECLAKAVQAEKKVEALKSEIELMQGKGEDEVVFKKAETAEQIALEAENAMKKANTTFDEAEKALKIIQSPKPKLTKAVTEAKESVEATKKSAEKTSSFLNAIKNLVMPIRKSFEQAKEEVRKKAELPGILRKSEELCIALERGQRGQRDRAEELIAEGADINYHRKDGKTPLLIAIGKIDLRKDNVDKTENDHTDLFNLILKCGQEIDLPQLKDAISLALKNKHLWIAESLVDMIQKGENGSETIADVMSHFLNVAIETKIPPTPPMQEAILKFAQGKHLVRQNLIIKLDTAKSVNSPNKKLTTSALPFNKTQNTQNTASAGYDIDI